MEKIKISLNALLPPLFLVTSVLGSIMFGWAAPTEAAGMGALGSILLAIFYRKFSLKMLNESVLKTLKIRIVSILETEK